jgi:hypothetical protein
VVQIIFYTGLCRVWGWGNSNNCISNLWSEKIYDIFNNADKIGINETLLYWITDSGFRIGDAG